MQVKEYPILFKKGASGKIRVWCISVTENKENSVIISKAGVEDGKIAETNIVVNNGKNINKKNETSPFEQAVSQANKMFLDKERQGYSKNKKVLYNPKLPMLAHNFNKRSKDIKYPCYVQPKLDGIRGVFDTASKKLLTRTNKEIVSMPKLLSELKKCKLSLDGELYSNVIPFNELSGMIRKQEPSDEKDLIYVVYDYIPDDPKNPDEILYINRLEKLTKEVKNLKSSRIIVIPGTVLINSIHDLKSAHSKFISHEYEGTIIRNQKCEYQINKRSKDLQKYKDFQDEEFTIVGATQGVGRELGAVIWICEINTKKRFNVRPRGTLSERKKLYKDYQNYIGKRITVKFFEKSADGIPRFPTTLRNSFVERIN
jgi:DNA ligase-1